MARPKQVDNPTVTAPKFDTFRGTYEQKKRIVEEAKEVYDAAKRDLNDFRNETATKTSLCIPPVEFFMKLVEKYQPRMCVLWLKAGIIVFRRMGVFDQADAFLVEELIEEIRGTQQIAA